MPEECKKERSVRSAIIGSSVIFWILAVFMINSMNSIKAQIEKTNQFMQTYMYIAGQGNLAGYQLVDPEGKAVYTFERLPEPEMEMMEAPAECGSKQEGACEAKAACGDTKA